MPVGPSSADSVLADPALAIGARDAGLAGGAERTLGATAIRGRLRAIVHAIRAILRLAHGVRAQRAPAIPDLATELSRTTGSAFCSAAIEVGFSAVLDAIAARGRGRTDRLESVAIVHRHRTAGKHPAKSHHPAIARSPKPLGAPGFGQAQNLPRTPTEPGPRAGTRAREASGLAATGSSSKSAVPAPRPTKPTP
jgi:hypothetical protein